MKHFICLLLAASLWYQDEIYKEKVEGAKTEKIERKVGEWTKFKQTYKTETECKNMSPAADTSVAKNGWARTRSYRCKAQ